MGSVVLKDLCKFYKETKANDHINLTIENGEFITLVGPSGCGKTTTLRMIAGLLEPTSGQILFDDKDVTWVKPQNRNVGMVFQDYALFPHLNVWENIAFGLRIKKYDKEDIKKRVVEGIRMVNLEGYESRALAALSGGQRQRVALARALVMEPHVFLMDEPLSNLDAKLRLHMRTEIKRIHKRVGITTIYVTHDQVEAMTLSTRVVVMKDGLIQQVGSPEDVYERPVNRFVGGFIGSPPMNFLTCHVSETNGKMSLVCDKLKFEVPPRYRRDLQEGNYTQVIVGIRPENLEEYHSSIDGDLPGSEIDDRIEMMVDVVEPIGADKYLDLYNENIRLLAKVNADCQAQPDQKMTLKIDLSRIHLFDVHTEKKLPIVK